MIFKLAVIILIAAIAWKDWKTKRIPDKYVLYMFGAGIISIMLFPEILILRRMAGLFAVSVPLLVLAGIAPGSIGGGDIKIMAAGGFLLGATGVWDAFVTGIMSAGVFVLILLIMKKVHYKCEIALGPFLSMGMILVLIRI